MARKSVRAAEAAQSKPDAPVNGRELVAQNVRRFRSRAGLSQEALADRARIHRTYVGSIERAERNISVDNICKLAWALGIAPSQLLERGEDS